MEEVKKCALCTGNIDLKTLCEKHEKEIKIMAEYEEVRENKKMLGVAEKVKPASRVQECKVTYDNRFSLRDN